MENNLYCEGCGAKLQTTDEQEVGYIPKIVEKNEVLCRRCFKLRHYNTNEPVSLQSDDFRNMISEIRKTDSLIIHVIDLFDVDATLLKGLPRIVGNNPIVLVANKLDILPKSTNHRKVKDWLRSMAKEIGLKVIEVHLISARKGHSLDELAKDMEILREGKDIYVVGVTNVGKSTFINQFIQRSTGIKESITTSYFPGTTLGFIEIPLSQSAALIDTPGIINENQLSHYVSKKDLKVITPNKEIKPRNYQIHEGQSLFMGGFVQMDFIKGAKQTFVCYFANELPVHRTKTENASSLYEKQIGKLLSPPNIQTLETLSERVQHSFKIKEPYTDIVISGLGWITILNGDVTITIHSPKEVSVTLRKSFISK